MKIGVMFDVNQSVDDVIAQVQGIHDVGLDSAWTSQIFGYDALTLLAVIGREVPDIELGTAVVPTYPRNPVMLAGQALTVQAAIGGRLTLGIGLSHQVVIENVFGQSFDRPARHMREYLSILMPSLMGEQVAFTGETLKAATFGPLEIEAAAPPVLVAALGPTMLGLAPRVAVGLPVCVTDDVAAAREKAAELFAIYGGLPSYRAMLDREGVAGPADVAIVGTKDEVSAQVRRFADIGASDFAGAPFGSADEIKASVGALAELVGS